MAKLKEVESLYYTSFSDLREAKRLPDDGTGLRRYSVVLLTEGKGNPRDKHYYSLACIQDPSTCQAFEGKPCFINHSDAIEEQARPERDLRDQAGWYSNLYSDGNALKGTLTLAIGKQGDELEGFIETALAYAKENPGQNYCGISINAGGPTSTVMLDGQEWKQVDKVTEADSADAVTKPARGGMFEKKLEAFRKTQETGVEKILKAIRAKAEAGTVDPKEFKRMADNAISALHGNQPEPLEDDMKMTKQAMQEAKKKAFPGMSEEEAQAAAKALGGFHAGCAEKEKDPGKKAIHLAAAERYKSMSGEEEGEGEGDLTISHKDPSTDGDDVDGQESEDEGEGEEESEVKQKCESLRKENEKLRKEILTKSTINESMKIQLFETALKESGLPESWHESVKILAHGKSLKESLAVIEAEKSKFEGTFKESFNPRSGGHSSTSSDDRFKEAIKVMEEVGL